MSPFSVLLLAMSMSADAFAVSVGRGTKLGGTRASEALRTGLVFGIVEAATPFLGWLAGVAAADWVSHFDHWLAFGLLAQRLVARRDPPRVVYLDVSPATLDALQTGWLLGGLRALGGLRELPVAAAVSADLFWETLRTVAFRSYHRWEDVQIAVARGAVGAPVSCAHIWSP